MIKEIVIVKYVILCCWLFKRNSNEEVNEESRNLSFSHFDVD